jgi:hypothetical protein
MSIRPVATSSRLLAIALVALLAACGGNGDDEPAPTATATPLQTSSSPISDGICQALVPDDWLSDGAGRGVTPSGARYSLFGGRIASDEGWSRGADLVVTQAAARPAATVERAERRVVVRLADDRGQSVRVRLEDRYCDFSLTSFRPIPQEELAMIPAIESSLAPASS